MRSRPWSYRKVRSGTKDLKTNEIKKKKSKWKGFFGEQGKKRKNERWWRKEGDGEKKRDGQNKGDGQKKRSRKEAKKKNWDKEILKT